MTKPLQVFDWGWKKSPISVSIATINLYVSKGCVEDLDGNYNRELVGYEERSYFNMILVALPLDRVKKSAASGSPYLIAPYTKLIKILE